MIEDRETGAIVLRTRAGLLTAGIGAVSLAAGLAFLGVTGQAEAATTIRDLYCYKNPDGTPNPDRIYVSQVVVSDPTPEHTYSLTWQYETQAWVDLGPVKAYTNPTSEVRPGSAAVVTSAQVAALRDNPDYACENLTYQSAYRRGVRA